MHLWPIIDQILLTKWTETVIWLLKLFRKVFQSKWVVYQPRTTSRSLDITDYWSKIAIFGQICAFLTYYRPNTSYWLSWKCQWVAKTIQGSILIKTRGLPALFDLPFARCLHYLADSYKKLGLSTFWHEYLMRKLFIVISDVSLW